MKICGVIAPVLFLVYSAGLVNAQDETAFTYQGRLLDAGQPANGLFDFRFSLFSTDVGGIPVAGVQVDDVSVNDGLFNVQIDFGADAFDNNERWLEIVVGQTPLSPRQPVTRAPYSIQTRGMFVGDNGNVFFPNGFVGVGRNNPITATEYFGVHGPVQNVYAGMFISTDGQGGWPYYGYSAGGDADAWHYYDGGTGNWHLHNGGEERLTVGSNGDVGIGTAAPFWPLTVVSPTSGATIYASNTDTSGLTTIAGSFQVFGPIGRGVSGDANATAGVNYGVSGSTNSTDGYGVYSDGDFGGTGAKYFVQPHPYDPSKEIRFVCLEGNESGTYFRGSTSLVNGRAYIDVPEEFRLVSELDGLTVQLTPRGPNAALWVESSDLQQIIVNGNGNVEFDYFVNGVRRGFADLELIRKNQAYVPEVRGVPYGTQYTEGLRQVLVENGILNSDFTPNEQTATMMAWTLRDPETEGLMRDTALAKSQRGHESKVKGDVLGETLSTVKQENEAVPERLPNLESIVRELAAPEK